MSRLLATQAVSQDGATLGDLKLMFGGLGFRVKGLGFRDGGVPKVGVPCGGPYDKGLLLLGFPIRDP